MQQIQFIGSGMYLKQQTGFNYKMLLKDITFSLWQQTCNGSGCLVLSFL